MGKLPRAKLATLLTADLDVRNASRQIDVHFR